MYGSFYRSVETAELEEMVKTGQASGLISDVIRLSGGDDKSFIEALSKKHDVPFRNMKTLINTPLGNSILKKIGHGLKYALQGAAFNSPETATRARVMPFLDH